MKHVEVAAVDRTATRVRVDQISAWGKAWFIGDAPASHHGSRPLAADRHARSESKPRFIKKGLKDRAFNPSCNPSEGRNRRDPLLLLYPLYKITRPFGSVLHLLKKSRMLQSN